MNDNDDDEYYEPSFLDILGMYKEHKEYYLAADVYEASQMISRVTSLFYSMPVGEREELEHLQEDITSIAINQMEMGRLGVNDPQTIYLHIENLKSALYICLDVHYKHKVDRELVEHKSKLNNLFKRTDSE